MEESHIILNNIFTNDAQYWQDILKNKNHYLGKIVPNKIFIDGIPIEEVAEEKFIGAIKSHCEIVNDAPDSKIDVNERYHILITCHDNPGIIYHRGSSKGSLSALYLWFEKPGQPNVFERFALHRMEEVMKDFSYVYDEKVPKTLREKFFEAAFLFSLRTHGSDDFLEVNNAFWEALREVNSVLYPNIDIGKYIPLNKYKLSENEKHKEATKRRTQRVNKYAK